MLPGAFDNWLDHEWLLPNGQGGFSCGTYLGCPTRREHGWMIWNLPGAQLERWMLWSHASENLHVDGRTILLSNFEFNNAIDPHGYRHLTSVEYRREGASPSISWKYRLETVNVERRLFVVPGSDAIVVRYSVEARPEAEIRFQVWPLIAARPLGELRRKAAGELFHMTHEGAAVGLRFRVDPRIMFGIVGRGTNDTPVEFGARGDWWYNFRYRREAERGLDFGEDLMVPGAFSAAGRGSLTFDLVGIGGVHEIKALVEQARKLCSAAISTGCVVRVGDESEPSAAERVRPAAVLANDALLDRIGRQFVIRRPSPGGPGRVGLIAGYPWLEEYCRDACVSVPGLLLLPGRLEEARELLLRVALLRRDGAVPSHLMDDPRPHDYVSADAALWFNYAVDAYLEASGDSGPVANELLKASQDVVRGLASGLRPGVRCDEDGLLICEDPAVAATWMDARYAWIFSTPRIGKPVEVNALWYHALSALAARLARRGAAEAEEYRRMAEKARTSFCATFWNEKENALFDVVTNGAADRSVRPNQIFAAGLRHSPLDDWQAAGVVKAVQERLLTPVGLRTLAPDDPKYRGRYEGNIEQRERSAHQGPAYPWLLGGFIDAYLRVHGRSAKAKAAAREFLKPLMAHLAGLGAMSGINEMFDGDAPHQPRGGVNQAWSVAEVTRAWALTGAEEVLPVREAERGQPESTDSVEPSEAAVKTAEYTSRRSAKRG